MLHVHSENVEENQKQIQEESQKEKCAGEIEQQQQKLSNVVPYHLPFLSGCRSVDNFSKLNRIEEGTYGVVFRAKEKHTGEIVALKKVKMDREKEGFPITSLREISLLMTFKHPNIVDVKEIVVGKKLDSIFIVMEFVEHDLKDLMNEMKADTRFLTSEVKCLMQQLLSGVAYLHENWIIHRDLKTSNLLYSNQGILKIADFGMAREYGSPLKPYTSLVVTLWYRAPEILLGAKTYTSAIDIWSVGCIFAELLTKEPLLPGRSELDQLDKIFKLLGTPNESVWPGWTKLSATRKMHFTTQSANHLRQRIPFVTEACCDLLQRMLCFDPAKRISASDALQHPYFRESPRAKDPALMPTWPSVHDGSIKKRRRSSVEEEELRQKILMLERSDTERFAHFKDRAYEFKLKF